MSAMRYLVIGLAVVAMVWPSAAPETRTRLAGSQWRLIEVDGLAAEDAGTIRFTRTSVRGKAACNLFFGAFRESDGSIMISGLNTTRKHCLGRMGLERSTLDAFMRVHRFRSLDDGVVLLDKQGREVARLAA